jgi:hypothetical protein
VPVITLIGKPGCHLCDDARDAIGAVIGSFAAAPDAPEITVEELSILDDPELNRQYWEEIPVVLVDGRKHTFWRVDQDRLHTAILSSAKKSADSKGTE